MPYRARAFSFFLGAITLSFPLETFGMFRSTDVESSTSSNPPAIHPSFRRNSQYFQMTTAILNNHETIKTTLQLVSDKLETLEESQKQKSSQIRTITAEKEGLSQQLTDKARKLEELTQEKNDLETRLQQEKETVEEKETQIQALQEALNAEKENLSQQLTDKERELEALTQAKKVLETCFQKEQVTVAEKQAQIQTLQQSLTQIQTEKAKLSLEKGILSQQLTDKERELEELEKEKNALEAGLQEEEEEEEEEEIEEEIKKEREDKLKQYVFISKNEFDAFKDSIENGGFLKTGSNNFFNLQAEKSRAELINKFRKAFERFKGAGEIFKEERQTSEPTPSLATRPHTFSQLEPAPSRASSSLATSTPSTSEDDTEKGLDSSGNSDEDSDLTASKASTDSQPANSQSPSLKHWNLTTATPRKK